MRVLHKSSVQKGMFFLFYQVVHDVGSQCNNTEGLNGSTSPIIQRKLELDKVCGFLRHQPVNLQNSLFS